MTHRDFVGFLRPYTFFVSFFGDNRSIFQSHWRQKQRGSPFGEHCRKYRKIHWWRSTVGRRSIVICFSFCVDSFSIGLKLGMPFVLVAPVVSAAPRRLPMLSIEVVGVKLALSMGLIYSKLWFPLLFAVEAQPRWQESKGNLHFK